MRILDLFCGAGGASEGLFRALPYADITGVDIKPQKNYPFRFLLGDAMTFPLDAYDLVWASPPCQLFTSAGHLRKAQGRKSKEKVDLLTPTLKRLKEWGGNYIVENVVGAPLDGFILCGSSFGLKVRRHRVFQTSFPITTPIPPCRHKEQGRPVGVYHAMNDSIPKGGRTARTLQEGRDAMGIQWMSWRELTQAIPPVYSEWIGAEFNIYLDKIHSR